VSYIAGFLVATLIMKFFIRRARLWRYNIAPMEADQVDSLITYLIVGVIVGGRLGYVVFYNLNFYVQNPIDIFKVWEGGMSFHGGFLGVVLVLLYYFRFNGINVTSGADLIALATPPGLLFGRIANFINAELWGKPTTVPWGIVFPGNEAQDCPSIIGLCARHPSQLYEGALEGLLLLLVLIIMAFSGALRKPGLVTGAFIMGYGFSRYLVEFFRQPDQQFVSLKNPNGYVIEISDFGASMGQLLSLPMILLGLVFIAFSFRIRKV
jgi:phosphatidylglycerol:prolipoprotein diacylglycerol transferase